MGIKEDDIFLKRLGADQPTSVTSAILGVLLGFAILLLAGIAFTWIVTTIQFRMDVRNKPNDKKDIAASPPLIPYAIPILGSTISFSNQKIGGYWDWLRKQSQRYGHDAFAIILSGTRTNFIFSADGVSAVFKSRQLWRNKLDQQLGVNVLGMSLEDSRKAFPSDIDEKEKQTTERIHSEHLLSSKAVDALTGKFIECFLSGLSKDRGLKDGVEVELYDWLWHHIFRATTTASCGSKLLEMYPDFDKDYRVWEDNILGMLFGTPRLFAEKAYAARDACVLKLQYWLREGNKHSASAEGDPEWEPYFGARVVRKRHDYCKQQGISLKGQASFDLIFVAGIISNATPATGWLLLHILSPTSPPDFRERIMVELESARRPDGSIDIPALTRLPLLNSAFHEMLRLYVDLLVVRQVDSSVALGHHYVEQTEQVMAPTWMTHRNAEFFRDPDTFDPERFLVKNEDGKLDYSTSGLNGKYFPFGGGHYMCPGRTFAKQEVLGSVAVLLLNFDVEVGEFVSKKGGKWRSAGREESGFPRPKNGYAGNQVVGIEGDLRVKIKRKGS